MINRSTERRRIAIPRWTAPWLAMALLAVPRPSPGQVVRLAGYDMGDEPSPAESPGLASLAGRLSAADPDALCCVTLLPDKTKPKQRKS